ncbi:MAG: hypothetical protein IAG13_35105 [Deltaproteobacteria bacterium]|nr:hypothetical protein [Nannocystaceae bacterium]
MRPLARILSSSVACGCLVSTLVGCGQPEPALLYVFSTHHATPENGVFPDRGDDEQPRVFANDEAWTVTLLESYITIDSITLMGCNGGEYPLNMFWGPCPEDLRGADLETLTVAGRKLDPGDYCGLRVAYGPYQMPVIDEGADTRHAVPQNEAVDGATVYFRGGARQGDDEETIPFELRGESPLVLDLDLSEVENGHPLRVEDTENFPKELTISKTYDRFFDGVDFADFDPKDLERTFDDVLEDQTRVQEGVQVEIE